ncbi:hypothetical protein [Bradyrhizobium elkanii]|jgi:hypothetical protein|uniref:hypothetical protein n=1 Tax=Bradyrhizobium elkanii TaxID=29448 RepID=UPI0004B9BAD1|nr:hypothetical protein [Bradyrhizobium elkanii]
MTDEIKLQKDAVKGARAKELLEHELLAEAFASLEAAYTQAWRLTTIDDVAGREKLFLAINVVGKVRDHLTSIMNNGTLAATELRQLAETAERARRWDQV